MFLLDVCLMFLDVFRCLFDVFDVFECLFDVCSMFLDVSFPPFVFRMFFKCF
ncbi:unnamed protein product [Meloidogyne enterolobii]|uniref:Uncharacterized protein n=1 Tax=Meloidogyne enterolobii TaxID=390850 RepID=A0ACB1ATT0_MELEN